MKKVGWMVIPATALVLVCIVFESIFFVGVVPSSSMEPTIPKGSWILGLRIFQEPGRGDVVIFRHEGKILVKRIVAVGGDVVCLNGEDGTFSVNPAAEEVGQRIPVPEGCFFVVGDHHANSRDSRTWEFPFVFEDEVLAVIPE